jgi:hypothetical protein
MAARSFNSQKLDKAVRNSVDTDKVHKLSLSGLSKSEIAAVSMSAAHPCAVFSRLQPGRIRLDN